jgi:hypothetical protein
MAFHYSVAFKGEHFSAADDLNTLTSKVERVFKRGAKKQKIKGFYDFGYLRISGQDLLKLLNDASDLYDVYKESIDEVEVDITYFYDSQCNLEFSEDEIKAISKLNANLLVSCVHDDGSKSEDEYARQDRGN